MDDVPDQAKGPEPDGQDEERSDRPDSFQDVNQVLQLYREPLPNNVNFGSRNYINEAILLLIAKRIGMKWREFATVLGLLNDEVQPVSIDYPNSIVDRVFHVLILWKEKYQGITPVQDLTRALKTVDRCDIAADVEGFISEQCEDPNAMPSRKFNERQRGPCVPGEENIKESLCGFYNSTKDLRDSERLGKSRRLPNFVAEYVDASGGFLDIPKYDVTLMIPKGAIETGMVQEVYLHVGPKTKYLVPEAPTRGPLFGQLVTFGPPGLTFKRHLILHIPLISGEEGDDDQSGNVDKKHPPMETTDWSNIASDNDIIVKERQIIMVLANFPRHCLELTKLMVCVTTPLFNPSEECIQFRVKLWDELRDHYQTVSINEKATNIEINLESGDLDLNMTDLHYRVKSVSGDGVHISTAKLKENSMNEVLFQLHHTTYNDEHHGTRRNVELLCNIQIRQRSNHEAFRSTLLPVDFPKKSTGQDKPPDDSPSYARHQTVDSSSERDQPDLPLDMTEWTNDEVRQWLLYIGIPGASVSKFVTAQTDGDTLATYSDSGLEKDFSFSKNLRELILNSRNSWLDKARARSRGCNSHQPGFVSTGSSHKAETEVICNDFLIEPETSTIHLNDEPDKQSTTIDLSVSVCGRHKNPGWRAFTERSATHRKRSDAGCQK